MTADQCFDASSDSAIATNESKIADAVTGACKFDLKSGQCYDVDADAAVSTSASVHKETDGACVTIGDNECWDNGPNDVVVGKQERDENGDCFTPEQKPDDKGEETEETTATTTTATTTEDTTTAATTTTAGEDSSS